MARPLGPFAVGLSAPAFRSVAGARPVVRPLSEAEFLVSPLPALSGQIALTMTAATARASNSPTIAAARLIIRRIAKRADQPGRDQHDDQQRDAVQDDRPDVTVGAQ